MDEEVRWTKTTIEIHFVQVENQNVIFFSNKLYYFVVSMFNLKKNGMNVMFGLNISKSCSFHFLFYFKYV